MANPLENAVADVLASRTGRVLIVEDDAVVAASIKGVLEDEGFSAEIARTVAEARARIACGSPSLILLDWNLPDGSGEDLVRSVRPTDPSVPIVVMSAQREAIVGRYSKDANDSLSKPFDLERLVALVRRYVG